jgi:hypothetical protein
MSSPRCSAWPDPASCPSSALLTRAEFFERIQALPDAAARARALYLAHRIYGRGPKAIVEPKGTRILEHRRSFFGDPARYIRDVLGWHLTPQEERVLDAIEKYDRVLIPSGNNLGKTFLTSAYAVYRMDVVAAMPDTSTGLDEQGAHVVVLGPDGKTIKTFYKKMLVHAAQAERRGFRMPGQRSEAIVHWWVPGHPEWQVEAISPPKRVGEEVAHGASGRHHANMLIVIEEGAGVVESRFKAAEGMASGDGNKIVSPFNPTEAAGAAYERGKSGSWFVLHMNALEHPNVKARALKGHPAFVGGGAVAFRNIDARVRSQCVDRGPVANVAPDPKQRDFVYALPPALDSPERGPRRDGHLGHPDGALHVYRPRNVFQAQVLGQWPLSTDTGLFDGESWDASVERWKKGKVAAGRPPTRVGVDLAWKNTTGDDICAAPAWGTHAADLLREYAAVRTAGPEAIAKLQRRRIRVGEIEVLPHGTGPKVAAELVSRWPASAFVVDVGGVGTSAYDALGLIPDVEVQPVSFGGSAPVPVPEEDWSENMRTAMYQRAALLLRYGLVDVPPDELLRQELFAHRIIPKTRRVQVRDEHGAMVDKRMPSALLLSKDEVKKIIGRSPDRADAFVLALTDTFSDNKFEPHVY